MSPAVADQAVVLYKSLNFMRTAKPAAFCTVREKLSEQHKTFHGETDWQSCEPSHVCRLSCVTGVAPQERTEHPGPLGYFLEGVWGAAPLA